MKTAARSEELSSRAHGQHTTSASDAELLAQAPTKIARVLAYLLPACNSLNRFEAEALGDHCLNSTISDLSNRYGLGFKRQLEEVPNRFGKPCLAKRYSLPDSEHDKARKVLALLNQQAKDRKGVAE